MLSRRIVAALQPQRLQPSEWIRLFHCTAVAESKRQQLRKPNYSSLSKHLKPDGLTGRQRREVLRAKLREHKPRGEGPYIPVKRRLEPIRSDNVQALTAMLANQTFDSLGLSDNVVNAALHGHLHNPDAKPTEIQALTIPKLLSNEKPNVLCAAETGSGKTLAYLLPVIDRLKRDEKSVKRRLDHPRAIVLVPTRELISQVVRTCKSLAHIAKFRAIGLDSKTPRRQLIEQLENPIDMLITTPTTLRMRVADGTISLSDTRYLVADEADSLFDAGWGDDVQKILASMRTANARQNVTGLVVIVSATLPRSVHRMLDEMFGDNLTKITTPSLHKALPNLKQSFVSLEKYNGNRQLALLDVLKKNIKDDKVLIFCNTKHSLELLHKWLASKDLPVLALHKDVDRKETLEKFSTPNPEDKSYNVMLSTDIASRGIDTTFVNHVILYDFPASIVDFLHRVGRTARAGQKGKATALVGRKDKMMADRIRRAIREGSVLT